MIKKFKGRKIFPCGTFWNWAPRAGIFGPGSKLKSLKDAYQRGRFKYEAMAELQHQLLTRLQTLIKGSTSEKDKHQKPATVCVC